MGNWQGAFGGNDGSEAAGMLATVSSVACGISGQVYTSEDLPGRGQAWDAATMTYVALIDAGAHDVSDSFQVCASPLDGSVAILSHAPNNSVGNYVQWFQQNLTWIRKVGTGGSAPGQFRQLLGIAFDNSGNLYTYDTFNGVQKWDTSGSFVGVTGLRGVESFTTVLSSGLYCVAPAFPEVGASIWDAANHEIVVLADTTGAQVPVNFWNLPPGTGTGNTGCHIYTTTLFSTTDTSTVVWKYTQAGALVGSYYIDLTQRGIDATLASLRAERPFAFCVSGDERQLFLGTQPNDGGINRAYVYKFLFPPDDPGDTWMTIAGRGAC